MTYSEAKLLAQALASRVDLACSSYGDCYVMDEEEAELLLSVILMEYVERSNNGIP